MIDRSAYRFLEVGDRIRVSFGFGLDAPVPVTVIREPEFARDKKAWLVDVKMEDGTPRWCYFSQIEGRCRRRREAVTGG